MVLTGGSGSGKSTFTSRLVKYLSEMTSPPIHNIIWSYAEWQSGYSLLSNSVTFVEGLPEIKKKFSEPTLLIIDDQMNEIGPEVTSLFTKGSHHKNVSVILILQNLFGKNKELRTINLNTHFIILFKNPRDSSQVAHLASQMYSKEGRFLRKVYADATIEPYSYLMIDYSQLTPEQFRLRTAIFPDDPVHYVYVKKK